MRFVLGDNQRRLPQLTEVLKSESEETKCVSSWLSQQAKAGVLPHELAVLVRSPAQLDRARLALRMRESLSRFSMRTSRPLGATSRSAPCILPKGLEFRSVAVMACDDEIIPLQERIETVGDDADLQEVYDTERHLL